MAPLGGERGKKKEERERERERRTRDEERGRKEEEAESGKRVVLRICIILDYHCGKVKNSCLHAGNPTVLNQLSLMNGKNAENPHMLGHEEIFRADRFYGQGGGQQIAL
ncbi:MAG: hypothetical protein LBI02_06455 [Opitutaceae bacterium]|jgi:hypothetical protein|nr:hypothetical protein [Opitutaceae bacterium]